MEKIEKIIKNALQVRDAIQLYNQYSIEEWIKAINDNNAMEKKDLQFIANMYQISLSSVTRLFRLHRDNFDLVEFVKKIETIKPYKKSGAKAKKVSMLNGLFFTGINEKNINKYKTYYIESDQNITHQIVSSDELYTLHESGTFKGISYTDYIIYSSIQSLLDDDNEQKITLRQIYESLYCTRFDKASLEAKKQLLISIINLNAKLIGENGIGGITYVSNLKKNKIKIGVENPLSSKEFTGYCRWNYIHDWEMPDKVGGKQYSLRIQEQSSYENTTFTCKRGLYYNILKGQHRITTIPPELIVSRNIKNNVYVNYYIARYLLLASNSKNKIKPVILFSTLEKYFGAVSRDCIKKIMENAKKLNYIQSYKITSARITFAFNDDNNNDNNNDCCTIMKNEKKEIVKIDNLPEDVEEREQKIRDINQFNSKHHVTLDSATLSTDIRQIFNNNNWHNGGRLYTAKNGYQAVKSADRAKIQIDGVDTVELDYCSCQIALLYAYEGLQAPDDSYSFFPERKLAKKALNMAINAKNKITAVQSLLHQWNNAHPDKTITMQQAESVIDDAISAHTPIKKYIASGVGVGLQRLDSDIAIAVCYRLKKEKIVALPIHDSFIVQEKHKARLMQIMLEEYTRYTGGFTINVK